MHIQTIFGDSTWTLPPIGGRGYIINKDGLCLSWLLGKNNSVDLVPKDGHESDDQMWFRGYPSENGNFTLQSEINNLFLTVHSNDERNDLVVNGKLLIELFGLKKI